MRVISAQALEKSYRTGEIEVAAIRGADFSIDPAALQRHGLQAQKGDRVKVEDLGNGRHRVTHLPSGKAVEVQVPAK